MGGVESGEASRHNGKKTMKAPGKKDQFILREDFENNPKKYFHDLRNKGDEKGSVRTENQNQIEASDVAIIVGGAAALAGLAYGVYCALSSSGSDSVSDKKTMKAPGKKGQVMYRDDFANDPKGYFRDLRNKGEVIPDKKTMKAPGKDGVIFRDDFVKDPKGYFRDLRNKGEVIPDKKTMKGPGKDGDIFRDDFINDPKGYFRDLHNQGRL